MDVEQEEFQRELSWCIMSLRAVLKKPDVTRNRVKETLQALQILESTKAPVIKKRMFMRKALGDYRSKMLAEENSKQKQILHGKLKLAQFTSERAAESTGKVIAQAAEQSTSPTGTQRFSFGFEV